MSTPATDYNQQLLAYLQMLRQLLDQCMAMATAGMAFPTAPFAMPSPPFMAPGGQFMPPMPPSMPPSMPPPTASAPPAPGDYAQQLFGYLQAWRQYLEQVAGAGPGSGSAQPPQAQDGPTPPGNGAGAGDDTPHRQSREGSGPTVPPRLVGLPPTNPGGSQLTATNVGQAIPSLDDLAPTSYTVSQISGPGFDPLGSFEQGPLDPQMLTAPGNDLGTYMPPPPPFLTGTPIASGVVRPGTLAEQSAGSPFQSAIDRLDPAAVQEVAPKSLFSTPEA